MPDENKLSRRWRAAFSPLPSAFQYDGQQFVPAIG